MERKTISNHSFSFFVFFLQQFFLVEWRHIQTHTHILILRKNVGLPVKFFKCVRKSQWTFSYKHIYVPCHSIDMQIKLTQQKQNRKRQKKAKTKQTKKYKANTTAKSIMMCLKVCQCNYYSTIYCSCTMSVMFKTLT